MNKWLALAATGTLALGVAACGDDDSGSSGGGGGGKDLSGSIKIDGSSTVGPFAQAAAEGFQGENPNVKVSVGTSGTGGGFEKFCAGETDISDASRPIKDDEEVPLCKKGGVTYKEIQVANDGIAVVTNKDLKIDCMTTDELKKLWNQGSKVTDLQPAQCRRSRHGKVSLFGPGTDSGTFDFFTDEINGEEGVSRKEYQPSEDDNVLVQGVEGDKGGLGYFGFSYYEQNQDKLNLVGVDGGDGCVKPSTKTIQDNSYKPLSRPLFMYPSEKSLAKARGQGASWTTSIKNQDEIAKTAQIVPLTAAQKAKGAEELKAAEAAAEVDDGSGDSGHARHPQAGGGAPPRRRGRDQGPAPARGPAVGADHHRHRALAAAGDDRLPRGRPRERLPLRHRLVAGDQAPELRRACRWCGARCS